VRKKNNVQFSHIIWRMLHDIWVRRYNKICLSFSVKAAAKQSKTAEVQKALGKKTWFAAGSLMRLHLFSIVMLMSRSVLLFSRLNFCYLWSLDENIHVYQFCLPSVWTNVGYYVIIWLNCFALRTAFVLKSVSMNMWFVLFKHKWIHVTHLM